ncbi:hypothetical protein [uncultured Psychrobacter sp.]|uniref:hypothetical protein n=1 Tax=Psychrobacter sp. DM8 TaxID=3440636 RepID=UPI00293D97DA|nr:hypothetical protein [uncultured Psychrobacter sp.]
MVTRFTLPSAKALTLPLALAAITVFSGCATTTSPEARQAYDKTQQNLKSQSVGIISDGCVLRVEVGKDDIMYQNSDALSVAIANTLKERLTDKGVTVKNISSPFICGALTQKELAQMDILASEDAKDVLNTDYPVLSSSNTFDGVTNQAYLNLYMALVNASKAGASNMKTGSYTPLNLDAASLNAIRKTEGTNKVFVVLAAANKQSFGLKLAAASTSPLAGAMINRAPGKDYSIHLVNLETNQIEWNKFGKIDSEVFKAPVTGTIATKKMLDPLYPE